MKHFLSARRCSPHNAYLINNYLQETFYDQRIANNGPFLWPPRSPDLSVLDYFIWGTVKNVYESPLTTIKDRTQRVRNAFQNISQNSIRKATHEELMCRGSRAEF